MKKQFLITLLFVSFSTISIAQNKVFHLQEGEKDWSYAQAYRSGNLLYISGTVGRGDMSHAVKQVYDALQKTLRHYNMDFTHVVKENLYTTDIEGIKQEQKLRKTYYGDHTPAATWVQVVRLFTPEDVLEVELIAEINKTE